MCMMNLQERIAQQRAQLRPCETLVTLSSGQMVKETHTNGNFASVVLGPAVGFVVDNEPDLQVANIIPRLYMGSQDVVFAPGLLDTHSVTHILSIGVKPEMPIVNFQHLFVPLLDLPEVNVTLALDQCLTFIDGAQKADGCVFVHCNAGVSRSATVVIAYLIKTGMSFEDAYQLVKSKRKVIKPNNGFIKFLREYEKKLRT